MFGLVARLDRIAKALECQGYPDSLVALCESAARNNAAITEINQQNLVEARAERASAGEHRRKVEGAISTWQRALEDLRQRVAALEAHREPPAT